jgi:hypothetical protein
MDYALIAAVGRKQPNRPSDVAQVRDLLNRVPQAEGGPGRAVNEGDIAGLCTAIDAFQTRHLGPLKLKSPDGVISRSGGTLELLYAKATPIPNTVSWSLPPASQHMQADDRWWLVNLNNTSSIEYTYWYRGCALSAAASAFAAKNIRLSDVAKVEELAKKKHTAAKAHLTDAQVKGRKLLDHGITDFAAINPLTLDAWMTNGSSQGYQSRVSAELNWEKLANVSARITFEAWLKPEDRRFPSPAMLRAWLDGSKCIIGNVHGGDHFVVLTGYKTETQFLAFDVGYPVNAATPNRYHGPYTYFAFKDFVLLVTYTFGA